MVADDPHAPLGTCREPRNKGIKAVVVVAAAAVVVARRRAPRSAPRGSGPARREKREVDLGETRERGEAPVAPQLAHGARHVLGDRARPLAQLGDERWPASASPAGSRSAAPSLARARAVGRCGCVDGDGACHSLARAREAAVAEPRVGARSGDLRLRLAVSYEDHPSQEEDSMQLSENRLIPIDSD